MRSATGLWSEVDQASAYAALPNLTEPRPNLAGLAVVFFLSGGLHDRHAIDAQVIVKAANR